MRKHRLAWLFTDAFAYYYLDQDYFPLVSDLARSYPTARFRPVLGYSHAIIPAILTGRSPGETNIWNIFEFAPESSPFKWVASIPLIRSLDSHPVLRFATNRIISSLTGYDTANVSLKTLPKLTVRTGMNPFMDETSLGITSLVSRARADGFSISFHGYPRHRTDRDAVRSLTQRIGIDDFIICYLTGLDRAGHTMGPESISMRSYCTQFDRVLSGVIDRIRANGYNLVLGSDHGMTTVSKQLHLPHVLGTVIDDVTFFADSTIARFYSDSASQLGKVRNALDALEIGQTYDLDDLRRIDLSFTDRRFGDLFYLCDPGSVLVPNSFSVFQSNVRGMHGYDPSTETESGIVMSDIGTRTGGEINYSQLHTTIAEYLAR